MCRLDERERVEGITAFVDELVVGIINSGIYWTQHPRVETSVRELARMVGEHCEGTGEPSLSLTIVDRCIVHQGRALLGASLSAPKLMKPLGELKAGGFEFDRGVDASDFTLLLQLLTDRRRRPESREDANAALAARGCAKIRLLGRMVGTVGPTTPVATITPEGDRLRAGTTLEVPQQVYQGLVDSLQTTMMQVCCGDSLELGAVGSMVHEVLTTLDDDPKAILNLSRYENYDAYTFGHSIRVCILALNFARNFTSDEETLERIGVASLMHDVGKAKLPFELLHSTEVLSAEERAEMQKHTIHGGEILLEQTECDPLAVTVAFGHHRTEDGRGYPRTTVPLPVSTLTRIVKICDVYEALTAVRPYKEAMSPTRSYRLMLSMDGHFHRPLLRRFIELNGIFPNGSRVRLSTGETARVESQTDAPALPIVTVESTPDGDPLDETERRTLDLRRPPDDASITVADELLAAPAAATASA